MSVTPTQQYRLVVIRQAFGIWSFFSSNVPCVVPHWFAAVMRFFSHFSVHCSMTLHVTFRHWSLGYCDRIAVFAGRHGQFVVDRDIVRDFPNIRVVTCFEVFED